MNINKTTYRSIVRSTVATVIALVICFALPTPSMAQESKYKFDVGASLGMSGYVGDASNNILKHPGLAFDANGRYIFNTRLAVRALLSFETLSGNTADIQNVLPGGKQYSFKSSVFGIEARGEFNFFPYGIGERYKGLKRCTPYLTMGLGATLASCGGNSAFAPSLPMGFGVKYKLNPRLNLSAEFTMTKVFSDKVDGKDLHDLTGIKTSFIKNTDWISRFTLGFTYEFGERCETCHYVD